jgi:hypothetical protein
MDFYLWFTLFLCALFHIFKFNTRGGIRLADSERISNLRDAIHAEALLCLQQGDDDAPPDLKSRLSLLAFDQISSPETLLDRRILDIMPPEILRYCWITQPEKIQWFKNSLIPDLGNEVISVQNAISLAYIKGSVFSYFYSQFCKDPFYQETIQTDTELREGCENPTSVTSYAKNLSAINIYSVYDVVWLRRHKGRNPRVVIDEEIVKAFNRIPEYFITQTAYAQCQEAIQNEANINSVLCVTVLREFIHVVSDLIYVNDEVISIGDLLNNVWRAIKIVVKELLEGTDGVTESIRTAVQTGNFGYVRNFLKQRTSAELKSYLLEFEQTLKWTSTATEVLVDIFADLSIDDTVQRNSWVALCKNLRKNGVELDVFNDLFTADQIEMIKSMVDEKERLKSYLIEITKNPMQNDLQFVKNQ